MLVSRYCGTAELPTQPAELRKEESYVPLWRQCGSKQGSPHYSSTSLNSCKIRLSCCSQLLQTAANTVAVILQIPLLATGLQGWFLNTICLPQRVTERYHQEVWSSTAAACTLTGSIASAPIRNVLTFQHITARNAFYVNWSLDSSSVTSTPIREKNSRSSLPRI